MNTAFPGGNLVHYKITRTDYMALEELGTRKISISIIGQFALETLVCQETSKLY